MTHCKAIVVKAVLILGDRERRISRPVGCQFTVPLARLRFGKVEGFARGCLVTSIHTVAVPIFGVKQSFVQCPVYTFFLKINI